MLYRLATEILGNPTKEFEKGQYGIMVKKINTKFLIISPKFKLLSL